MTATPSTASQAPAVSIDTPEFRGMMLAAATAWPTQAPQIAALVKFIDAKLAQAETAGWTAGRQQCYIDALERSAVAGLTHDRDKWKARATAAEAKLEAIRQGVEGLTRWDDNLGMCPVDYGPWIARTEVLSLLQPQEPEPEPKVKYTGGPVEVRTTRYKLADPLQPQADESGLPG